MQDTTTNREVSESEVLDRLFDTLSHSRRRRVLSLLLEHGSLPLADLADEVATRERDETIAEIPPADVLDVYTSLYHVHVPKLEAASLVEYSQSRDEVALVDGCLAELVADHLDCARTDGD